MDADIRSLEREGSGRLERELRRAGLAPPLPRVVHHWQRETEPGGAGWQRVAILDRRSCPPSPPGDCTGGEWTDMGYSPAWEACTSRRPCSCCDAWREWEYAILDAVRGATSYSWGWGHGGPGRPYANPPWFHVKGSRVVVRQSGGMDI